jgi:hypothetical protein
MAAKTWQSVIDEAREILQDTNSDRYRYSNTVLLANLNRGVQELARLRPDALWDFLLDGELLVPQIVTTDADPDTDPDTLDEVEDGEVALSASFNLPMQFHGALVYWVASTAELVDDEYTNDGRAATLMGAFRQQVISL